MLTQHAQGQDQFFTKEVFYFGLNYTIYLLGENNNIYNKKRVDCLI